MNKTNKPTYTGRTKPSIKVTLSLIKETKQTIESLITEKKQLIKLIKQIKDEIVIINNLRGENLVKFEMMMLVGKINSKLKLYR